MKTHKTTKPIRCGVIGLGRIGWDHHIREHIVPNPGFELVAVCDIHPERLEEARSAHGCAAYRRSRDLLADPNVDLVVIASLTKDHVRNTRAALEAGKHVLVEKPLARTPQAVDRLIRLARRRRRLLTVHHSHRLAPHFLLVREVLEEGLLGRVFRVQRHHVEFRRRDDWQVLRKYGGGLAGNWGVHLIDQCLQLTPSPVERVWSSFRRVWNPGDAEDDLRVIMQTRDGTTLEVEVTYACAAPKPLWIVYGDRGTLWIEGDQARVRYFDPRGLKPWRARDLTHAEGRAYGKPDSIPWQERAMPAIPARAYPSFHENLHAALTRGAELLVTPESARRTYDALWRARRGTGF